VTDSELARLDERITANHEALAEHARLTDMSTELALLEERVTRLSAEVAELRAGMRAVGVVTTTLAAVFGSPVTTTVIVLVALVWLILTNHVK